MVATNKITSRPMCTMPNQTENCDENERHQNAKIEAIFHTNPKQSKVKHYYAIVTVDFPQCAQLLFTCTRPTYIAPDPLELSSSSSSSCTIRLHFVHGFRTVDTDTDTDTDIRARACECGTTYVC